MVEVLEPVKPAEFSFEQAEKDFKFDKHVCHILMRDSGITLCGDRSMRAVIFSSELCGRTQCVCGLKRCPKCLEIFLKS